MTAARHLAFAATLDSLVRQTDVSLHLAAERDDPAAAARHRDERNSLLELAAWHRAQAEEKRLSAVDGIEGLHDGPVHLIPIHPPGDDAIVN